MYFGLILAWRGSQGGRFIQRLSRVRVSVLADPRWVGRASGFAFQNVAEMMGHRNERQQQPQVKELS